MSVPPFLRDNWLLSLRDNWLLSLRDNWLASLLGAHVLAGRDIFRYAHAAPAEEPQQATALLRAVLGGGR